MMRFLVAHEMEHVIRLFDGQTLKLYMDNAIAQNFQNNDIRDLAIRLGSMFDDPLIDSFLQNTYDFKPGRFYTNVKIPDTIKSLKTKGRRKNELVELKQTLFYSQFSLQWDSINDDDAIREWRDLKKLYQKWRSIVKINGEELYFMVKENGYDTLEKQKQLFHKIANKYTIDGYKLSDILFV